MKRGLPIASVLITTRNRPDELCFTLESIARQTFAEREVLVLDDGSDAYNPELVKAWFPDVTLLRYPMSRGLITARNVLMRAARGRYFVHLDDDANWVRDDALERAIDLLERDDSIGAFAFSVHEGVEVPQGTVQSSRIYEVRAFSGCGHIIRRETFERLGPLKEEFGFYCEEMDFCLRAWDGGYRVVSDDALVVHHRVDWAERDRVTTKQKAQRPGMYPKDWRVRRNVRNELWCLTQRAPAAFLAPLLPFKVLRFLMYQAPKGFGTAVLAGVADWSKALPGILNSRQPVRTSTFRHWLGLH